MKRLITACLILFLGTLTATAALAGPSASQSFKIKVTLPAIAQTFPLQDQVSNPGTVQASSALNGNMMLITEEAVRDNQPVILKSFVVR